MGLAELSQESKDTGHRAKHGEGELRREVELVGVHGLTVLRALGM